MAEHHAFQVALERLQLTAVVVAHARGRNARDLGHDLFDLVLADGLLALARQGDALRRAGLVDDVDGLVGQVTVGDVFGRQLGGGLQGGGRVLDAVVFLEAALEALEDFHRLGHRRLDDVDLLEAPRQRRVLLEDAAVFGERGRADALELAAGERRLEQIGRVQRAARRRAGADQGVDFVDEQDGARLVLEVFQHAFQALLKVAAVLGAGQQRAHVERVDGGVFQHLGHGAFSDAPGQAFGDGRLADAGLAHQQRVVLAPAAQDLDGALDLVLAADQRVDLAVLGVLVQVDGELLQRRGLLALLTALAFALTAALLAFGRLGGFRRVALADAVGNEVDHVQPRHALLVQVVHGVRILFAKDRHQHVGAGDFLLAVARALHVHDGALDHALEAQRGLRVHVVVAGDLGRVVLDEVGERLAQVVDVGRAGAQHFGGARVVQQREQQVLDGDELVALLARLDKGHV